MSWADGVVLLLVAAAVYAEVKRGLVFAIADMVRIVLAVAGGTIAYALVSGWTRDYVASAIAFFIGALLVATLLDMLAKKVLVDSPMSKRPAARIGAGGIGLMLGLAMCVFVMPVLAQLPGLERAVESGFLSRQFLDAMPAISTAVDRLGIDLPQAAQRPLRYEDEGGSGPVVLAPRVRFSKLDRATCIACRGHVKFLGYFRTHGARVSPKFRCTNCGRVSDGCQTFEGFHLMYGRCSIQAAIENECELDCGVWSNESGVLPEGQCPVCGREGTW